MRGGGSVGWGEGGVGWRGKVNQMTGGGLPRKLTMIMNKGQTDNWLLTPSQQGRLYVRANPEQEGRSRKVLLLCV